MRPETTRAANCINTVTLSCLDVTSPVIHLAAGRFTAGQFWKHKAMHHEGNFEIIIVIRGTLYLQVDDECYELAEHDVFALPPFHVLQGYQDSPQDTQYYWFHFIAQPESLVIRNVEQTRSGILPLFASSTAVLPVHMHLHAIEREFVLANQILDVLARQYFSPLAVDHLLTSLIIQLAEDYRRMFIQTTLTARAARVEGIKSWIRANLSKKLQARDVAAAFSLNPHYLVRIFKAQTGETVVQYINRLKVERAKELLTRSNLTIKQIACMAFFPDEKRLMKAVKKATNLTPSQYRSAYTQQFLDSSSFDPEIPITNDVETYRRQFAETARIDRQS